MKNVLGRIRFIVLGVICIVCIFTYLVIFYPMEDALKESRRQKFIQSAEAVGYATKYTRKVMLKESLV